VYLSNNLIEILADEILIYVMQKIFIILCVLMGINVNAQFFTMRHAYSGSHFAFKKINTGDLNRFVVSFNQLWATDIKSGYRQFKDNEFGQTFTTSGMRFVWGQKDMKWTFSTDYALGFGKVKNKVKFTNGIEQSMEVRYTSNQINNTFGISLKENKVWLEALYCTNLSRVFIEYSTIHLSGTESFGSEYKLNGLYKGLIKTMEFGLQTSYRFKKRYVLYARFLMPASIIGPSKDERVMIDERSVHSDPRNFPANYESYVNDPSGHISRNEQMRTDGFKGVSDGFGMLIYLGKIKE